MTFNCQSKATTCSDGKEEEDQEREGDKRGEQEWGLRKTRTGGRKLDMSKDSRAGEFDKRLGEVGGKR